MALTGIFGGTFDPIHVGHLRTAVDLLDRLPLSEVRFVPCGVPPHRDPPEAAAQTRWAMLQIALAADSRMVADDRELRREGPSYMADTLESLRLDFKDRCLALILGMDAFAALDTWHRWQDILGLANIIVVQRPGSQLSATCIAARLLADHRCDDLADLSAGGSGRILMMTMTQLEISSSAIRDLVRCGRDPRYLVTDSVRDIIVSSGCYEPDSRGQQAKEEIGFRA